MDLKVSGILCVFCDFIAPNTTINANGGGVINVISITVEGLQPLERRNPLFRAKKMLDKMISESSLGFSDVQERQ